MSRLSTDKQNRLRKYFKQKEVAAALGVSTTNVRALIERGELTAVVVAGNCIRIPADELERFLQQRRIARSFYLRPNRLPMSDEPEDAQAAENPPARPELKERLPKAKPPRKARRYPPRITSLKATKIFWIGHGFPGWSSRGKLRKIFYANYDAKTHTVRSRKNIPPAIDALFRNAPGHEHYVPPAKVRPSAASAKPAAAAGDGA